MNTVHKVDDRNGMWAHIGSERPARAGQFGELDETDLRPSSFGTDLTLEWDSNDPNLHAHLVESVQEGKDDATDSGWNVDEMGIPDA
jgi:hypothetical protein